MKVRLRNRNKSFIRKTVVMMAVQLALLLLVLLSFLVFSYLTAMEEMTANVENLMQIYGKELDYKVINADRLLERLVYKNTDYDMLQSEKESDRYYAAVNIRKFLDESMVFESYVDMIVVAESKYGMYLTKENVYATISQKEALREFTMEYAKTGRQKAQWRVEKLGEIPYIYKMYTWQGKAAAVFVSVENFMNIASDGSLANTSILLADENRIVWGSYGGESEAEEGTPLSSTLRKGTKVISYSVEGGEMSLYAGVGIGEMMGQIRLNMLLMLLIILISLAEAIWLIRYIRLEVILPMRDMKENMDRMQEGNYGLRITKEYHNSEFALLKGTFNQLMDEIVGLKIKSYEKKLELQEAELKSIRLQIRPHFFLNAMTTISSLSIQGKNGEIKRYIDALSKNIRYMFKSGLHTVPISEEIRHVENYFEMQELKYPGCVFYFIEIQPGVETWRIPQMLIHTIIENEYKYAVAWDGILTILIKGEKVILKGKEFLSLEIEDDGKGYPRDVLEQFASEEIGPDAEGSRVGLWSVRRMIELMYEGEGSFQIENLVPKGAMNRFLIPTLAVHEFQER